MIFQFPNHFSISALCTDALRHARMNNSEPHHSIMPTSMACHLQVLGRFTQVADPIMVYEQVKATLSKLSDDMIPGRYDQVVSLAISVSHVSNYVYDAVLRVAV